MSASTVVERVPMRTYAAFIVAIGCAGLYACKPLPSSSAGCDAGSCARDAAACGSDAACAFEADASSSSTDASRQALTGTGSRAQASEREQAGSAGEPPTTNTRVKRTDSPGPDAGEPGAEDAPDQDEPDRSAQASHGEGGAGGHAADDSSADTEMTAGAEGDDACEGEACEAARLAACDATCETCAACSADKLSCEPVTGRDDADSCSAERSCSSAGVCLHISEAQPQLGPTVEYVELTTAYAQVIDFAEAASVEEIRLEVSCNENDESFPPVWISLVEDGVPSEAVYAFANVIYQPPTQDNAFALLELSKKFEEPQTGPIAIVVGRSDMSCIARINREQPYDRGGLFVQRESGLWLPAEGSMVFQVLSSR